MPSETMIPIVLFVYARPDHLQRTLDSLRENQIPKLIVYSDAARTPDKAEKVEEVRALIRSINWCEVELHERDINFGLGKSILTGMTEVFQRYEAAIVFEDDLICVPGLYQYLTAALTHYKDDPKVMSVTGWTHPKVLPENLNGLPYFDGRAECLVWGTWARSWADMDKSALTLMDMSAQKGIDINGYGADLPQMAAVEAKQNIWAVRWLYAHILHGGLCLRPPQSMVEHIGFDQDATNASDATQWQNPDLKPAPAIPAQWIPAVENPECARKWQAQYPVMFASIPKNEAYVKLKTIGKRIVPPIAWSVMKSAHNYGIKHAVMQFLPPVVTDAVRNRKRQNQPEEQHKISSAAMNKLDWEYQPQGWKTQEVDPAIKGWNDQSVLESYASRWDSFNALVKSKLPFGISSEALTNNHKNLSAHNVIMSYAYVLARAAHGKQKFSMLDWGGGIGHYYLYAQALMPDIEIDYTCKDVTLLAAEGQKNFPEALFTDDEETALNRQYDLTIASGSMHYTEDWRALFTRLAKSASGYLYISRMPTIHNEPSYVMVQRPYAYGFNTEYLGWCINRTEMLDVAKAANMELVREFIIEGPPYIYHAPEQCDYWGYLFRPIKQGE